MVKMLKSAIKFGIILGVEVAMFLFWMLIGIYLLRSNQIFACLVAFALSYLRFYYSMTYFHFWKESVKKIIKGGKNKDV